MKQVSSTTVAAVALNKAPNGGAKTAGARMQNGHSGSGHTTSVLCLRNTNININTRTRETPQMNADGKVDGDEWRGVDTALAWRDYGDTVHSKTVEEEEWSSTPIGLDTLRKGKASFDEREVREFERRVGYLITTPCEETRHMLISLGF